VDFIPDTIVFKLIGLAALMLVPVFLILLFVFYKSSK